MNGADAVALLPLIVLAATPCFAMVAIAIRRMHALTAGVTLIGFAVSFAALWKASGLVPRRVTPLLEIDAYSLFFTGLIVAAAFAVGALAYGYLRKQQARPEEFYLLLAIATLGACVLVAASHFVSFLLGLEILSVALYGLAAYERQHRVSLEAGIKYLVLAAASAAFLLFGMGLVYAETGTMEFGAIARRVSEGGGMNAVLLGGTVLIVTGIGFKLAVVPFHLWTPDVYEGAPAPATAFIATASKGAMFALLLRFAATAGLLVTGPLLAVFAIIAVASMITGNLLALLQNNVKRILAYSSIAHLGYILVAFEAGGRRGAEAVIFYLVAYFVTTLGAFGIVTVLSGRDRDAGDLADYRGLFWRNPALGGVFTAMLLSLAGIPVTAGFIGKVYVLAAGASARWWTLVIVLVVTSAIGLFYYLRIVVALYSRKAEGAPRPSIAARDWAVLAALTVLLVWFGTYPGPLLDVIGRAVSFWS